MAKGVRFRDSYAQYLQIKKDIEQNRFAPIYLLMGDEGYLIDSLTEMLDERLLPEEEKAFNRLVLYGKDTDEGTITNYARQLPMMGGRMVVIVKEAGSLGNIEKLSAYSAAPSPSTVLVIACKGKSVDKRSQFYKQCAEKGVVFESARPYDSELGPWLADYIKSAKGCTIEPKALTMLTDYLGADIAKIVNELSKLLTSLPEGTTKITPADIEENIGVSKDYNNFELLEAVACKDMAKAMRIADHFARNPKNNPLVVTIVTLFNYFQKLFIINYKDWQSKTKGLAAATDAELASLIRVNPYLLGGYKRAAALYPNRNIFLIFGFIREYDAKSKGAGGCQTDDGELLRELLMKIMMI